MILVLRTADATYNPLQSSDRGVMQVSAEYCMRSTCEEACQAWTLCAICTNTLASLVVQAALALVHVVISLHTKVYTLIQMFKGMHTSLPI